MERIVDHEGFGRGGGARGVELQDVGEEARVVLADAAATEPADPQG